MNHSDYASLSLHSITKQSLKSGPASRSSLVKAVIRNDIQQINHEISQLKQSNISRTSNFGTKVAHAAIYSIAASLLYSRHDAFHILFASHPVFTVCSTQSTGIHEQFLSFMFYQILSCAIRTNQPQFVGAILSHDVFRQLKSDQQYLSHFTTGYNNWEHGTPLFQAAESNYIECLQLLLQHHLFSQQNLNLCHVGSRSAVYIAAKNNSIACLEALLAHPACDITQITVDIESPLHVAARFGHDACVDRLLQCAVSRAKTSNEFNLSSFLNLRGYHNQTALFIAAQQGHVSCLSLMLQHPDFNINILGPQGDTPLHIAIRNKHTKCVELLMADPRINVNAIGSRHQTPLLTAIEHSNDIVVETLLSQHQDVDLMYATPSGETALTLAASRVSLWQSHQPSDHVDHTMNKEYGTTFHIDDKQQQLIDASNHCLDMILHDERLSIDSIAQYLPLHRAVMMGNHKVVERLLNHETVDVNASHPLYHDTPLMSAIRHDRPDMVTLLLSCPRVDPDIILAGGLHALTITTQTTNLNCLRAMLASPRVNVHVGVTQPAIHTALTVKNYSNLRTHIECLGPDALKIYWKGQSIVHRLTDIQHPLLFDVMNLFPNFDLATIDANGKTVLQYSTPYIATTRIFLEMIQNLE